MARFNISALKNGKEVNWIYDTANSHVYDEHGVMQLSDLPTLNFDHAVGFNRTVNPNKKTKENNLLEISLGFNCNFKCSYCSQNLLKNKAYSSKPSDVQPFIQKLIDSGLEPSRIQLWGGEPFVYWKTMELLIPELRKLYPLAHLSVTTNGSLLTREKVDFLFEYNVELYVSHDGPGNQYRDHDVLDDPKVIDAIQYRLDRYGTKGFMFATTLGKGNTDVKKVYDFFNQKFKAKELISVGVHNIVRCHDSKDLNQIVACTLSKEDLQTYTDSIFNFLMAENPDPNRSLGMRLNYAIETIVYKEPIEAVRAECCMPFSDGLLTDMQGNILTCHNHATQEYTCGKLDDLDSIHAIGYNFWANKKRCVECPVIHFCKGGCPSADDRANELACPNLYALYLGILKACFARLFGIVITDIKKE